MSRIASVTVFSPFCPIPEWRGNRARIGQVGRSFKARGFRVYLACPCSSEHSHTESTPWDEFFKLTTRPGWKPRRSNASLDSWYAPGLGEEIRRILERNGSRAIWFNYPFHSKALDCLNSNILKFIDTHDAFSAEQSLRVKTGIGTTSRRRFFHCTPKDEKIYLDRADVVVAITEGERSYFQNLGISPPVISVPYGLKPRSNCPATRPRPRVNGEGSLRVGIVLSANDPNRLALLQFVEAVERRFKSDPPFKVIVAGDIRIGRNLLLLPPRLLRRRSWLNYVGTASSLEGFFDSIDICVSPTTVGTGASIKFADAISAGVPTLSTSVGSRGFATSHELHLFANLDELVGRICRLDDRDLTELVDYQDQLTSDSANLHEKTWTQISRVVELWAENPQLERTPETLEYQLFWGPLTTKEVH